MLASYKCDGAYASHAVMDALAVSISTDGSLEPLALTAFGRDYIF